MGFVLAAGAVGCGTESGDAGDRGSADSALGGALGAVPASLAGELIVFHDVPTTRRLVAANHALYASLYGYGIRELVLHHTVDLKHEYGFDDKQVATSLIVGNSPTALLTGSFDPDAISKAMTSQHGYTAGEDDAGVHLKKQGASTIEVSDSVRIERSSASAPALPLTAPAKSVADDEAYHAAVDCLGDVYRATLYGKLAGENENVVLVSIGARTGGKDSSSETLCAVTASRKAAEATAKVLRDKETAPGQRYAGAKVVIGEGDTPVVSMTWRNKPVFGLKPGHADLDHMLPGLLLNSF